jgi:hypothetical protein
MNEDQELLESIRRELEKYFRRNNKYGLSEPLLFNEIRLLVNKIYDSRAESIYKTRGLSREDAFQDAVVHLLEDRGGIPAGHIYTVYFEYYNRNHSIGEPYTLAQSRKAMKIILKQAFLLRTNRSVAQNVLRRAIKLLEESPYETHFDSDARRFTLEGQPLDQLDSLPSEDALAKAVRFAANVPKIPQAEHAERMNKVFHTPDLHLVIQIILENAPGISISQLHKVFENLLTDRPSASVHNHEDMNELIDNDIENSNSGIAAGTAALVRSVANDIWVSTDRATKIILSCQFSGMPDVKIAESISFDVNDPGRRRSRAWVTTKFTDFGDRVSKTIAELDAEDQFRVSRLIEAHIVNFDSEKDQ